MSKTVLETLGEDNNSYASRACARTGENCRRQKSRGTVIILLTAALSLCLAGGAVAQCCGGGVWDPTEFLNSDVPIPQPTSSTASAQVLGPEYRSDDFPQGDLLKSMPGVSSSDLVLEASAPEDRHVKGAVNVPTSGFLEDGRLKPVDQLAAILGAAGVSRSDRVVVYGDPKDATLAFWVLSYLGQEDVALMDGGLDDWKAGSLPLESGETKKAAVDYVPSVNSKLWADYEYVSTSQAQIVDARSFQDYAAGKIPGAINIPPERVFEGSRVKDASDLEQIFRALDKSNPVVVYGTDLEGTQVLYALILMGYDARLYTWQDWQEKSSVAGVAGVTSSD